MKKGGYQILELNCESSVIVYNDYATEPTTWINIKQDFDYNKNKFYEYINNLFKYNKTCLLKNLLVGGVYLTFFTQIITINNQVNIYVVDSSKTKGYSRLPDEDNCCLIDDDYVLLIDNTDCTAIIVKLYKGAITQ